MTLSEVLETLEGAEPGQRVRRGHFWVEVGRLRRREILGLLRQAATLHDLPVRVDEARGFLESRVLVTMRDCSVEQAKGYIRTVIGGVE